MLGEIVRLQIQPQLFSERFCLRENEKRFKGKVIPHILDNIGIMGAKKTFRGHLGEIWSQKLIKKVKKMLHKCFQQL